MIQKKYGLHRLVAAEVIAKVGISGKEIAAMELLIKETTIFGTEKPVNQFTMPLFGKTAELQNIVTS
jgi:hypothetical protein